MPRIKREELWNLDTAILKFVLPRLRAFVKMKRNGYSDYAFNSQEEWEDVLQKMLWALEQQIKPDCGDKKFILVKGKYKWRKLEDGKNKLITLREEKYDSKGLKKHREKVQEGLDLFGKYWLCLWD
jgi:hypothetical protein